MCFRFPVGILFYREQKTIPTHSYGDFTRGNNVTGRTDYFFFAPITSFSNTSNPSKIHTVYRRKAPKTVQITVYGFAAYHARQFHIFAFKIRSEPFIFDRFALLIETQSVLATSRTSKSNQNTVFSRQGLPAQHKWSEF